MFVWRYVDAGGEEAGRSEAFDDESSAESWMGRSWEELLERGVEAVELVDVDGAAGGVRYRMSLRPES